MFNFFFQLTLICDSMAPNQNDHLDDDFSVLLFCLVTPRLPFFTALPPSRDSIDSDLL